MRTARTVAGACIGLALAVVAFEVLLRTMAASPWWRVLPAVQALLDRPDAITGYGHRENVEGLWVRENRVPVRMNAQGLRDRPRDDKATPGVVRVAVAGDSITEGLQVEENDLFTLRTERALQARGWPVEVLNFGLTGAHPLQQLLYLMYRGLPMGIDAAVFITRARDFGAPMMADDSIVPGYVENASGELVIGNSFRERRSHRLADRWIGKASTWIIDHSLVAAALYGRVKLGSVDAGSRDMAGHGLATCPALAENLAPDERLWAKGEPQEAARRLGRLLADVPVVLEGRPAIFALYGFGLPDGDCPVEAERRSALVALIRTRLDRAGIVLVDVDAAVAAKLADRGAYRLMFGFGRTIGRGHLNAFGHEIYSQVLTDVITTRLPALISRPAPGGARLTPPHDAPPGVQLRP
jgi:hypothetical protein